MKLSLLITVLLCSLQVIAQVPGKWKAPSKESMAYHNEYRSWKSVPSYGLSKVTGLLGKLSANDVMNRKLSVNDYNTLSLREKFTYHMVHGETFSQNCTLMPFVQDEDKKIFAQLLAAEFGEFRWSDRQYNFLKEQRDSVMAFIKGSVLQTQKMGVNYKQAVLTANTWEMIPFLISTYQTDGKDHDLLTLLMLLMKQNNYAPFISSAFHVMLYGEQANYRSSLELTKPNEDLIIAHAINFYKSKG